MKVKAFIFAQDCDCDKIERVLAERFCEIESLTISSLEQTAVAAALKSPGDLLLLCPNEQIDDLIGQNINALSNDKDIIAEQIVVFEKDGHKIIFAPVEDIDCLSKLKLGQTQNKTCSFKLFGLPKSQVEDRLDGLKSEIQDLQFVVLGRGLKCEIYINYSGADDLIDNSQVKIATAFKDYIYSDNSLDLEQSIIQLLRLKDLKLSILEGITGGAFSARLCASGEHADKVIKSGKLEFLTEDLTPDNVYKQTLKLLDSGELFAVNIQGQYQDGRLSCVYAIGNKLSIDVYNCSIRASREKAIDFALNAIMFNIIKKLRQNSLGF